MILIIGTPNSGKSKFAEDIILSLDSSDNKAYIATMEPYGEEGNRRVKKHQKMREGKGFITYEKPRAIGELCDDFTSRNVKTALLECVSNLVGNELYHEAYLEKSNDQITEIIVDEIKCVDSVIDNLVVVTNDFLEDEQYDDETKRYIEVVKLVNAKLLRLADKVLEI